MYQGGERLVDRLDFEELALKGIDPSLGPTITQRDASGQDVQVVEHEKVKVRHLTLSSKTYLELLLDSSSIPTVN